MNVKDLFLELISYPSASDEASDTVPSTPGQLSLGTHLVELMKSMGIEDAFQDKNGYIYGTIPATDSRKNTVGFIAHLDTYGGVSGADIHPQVIEGYKGDVIPLKNGGLSLSPEEFPALRRHVGKTLITTDGSTLLGGDDKAGIAEILCAAEEIIQEQKPHGTIKIAFTPDEEIGSGADHFDVQGFGCNFAYTVDGGALGELEYENFNAASASVEVKGLSIHTGAAKGKMLNSMTVAMEFCGLMPAASVPEHTEGYEGFIHLDSIEGNVEFTKMQFLIRDHDKTLFEEKKALLKDAASFLNAKYPSHPVRLTIKDSYYNMKEQILPCREVLNVMERAMTLHNVKPIAIPIRGGTDGARLSFMGLPCPNLCTGGANAHGRQEYVVLEEMETIKEIIKTAVGLVE